MKRTFRRSDPHNASRDVGDEIDFHLDMRTREFIAAGMSPEDARAAAARAFGDAAAIDAELRVARDAHVRSRARVEWLRELSGDIAFAFRSLRKNVAFTIAALATLTLGIGAAASVFIVVNGVLIRPLPYADPSRLVMTWISSKKFGAELPLSSGFYTDFANASRDLATSAGLRSWFYTLTAGRDAEQVSGARVTSSFFDVLGVKPRLGRGFLDSDANQGAPHVVVLTQELWARRFGADSSIIGKRIDLSGQSFTVVGVMPSGFAFPRGAELPPGLQFGSRTELWTPLSFSDADKKNYGTMNLSAVSRLKPGATITRLHTTAAAQLSQFVATNAPTLDLSYRQQDLRQQASQHVRRGLLLLLGAVGLLLIIACANVTNLLIARTAARSREFAVRAALGAGRMRIARQLMAENVLLALCGTTFGLVLSTWATRAMLTMVPGSLPRADDVGLDWRVATAALTLTVVVGIVLGLGASTQVGWHRLAGTLREDGTRATTRTRSFGRRALVIGEVSLSLTLVIAATLLAISFSRLERVDPGFDPHHTLTANIVVPVPGELDFKRDGPTWAATFQQLQDRLARTAGVVAAGAVSVLPLTDAAESGGTAIVGEPPPRPGQAKQAEYLVIEGDYFKVLGVPLRAGRAFRETDLSSSTPVAIVNEEYARRYLNGVAVDRQINTLFDFTGGHAARMIVGVVGNVQYGTLDGPAQPQVYLPEQQMTYPGLHIVLRVDGDPLAMLPTLKRDVSVIDPRLAVSKPRSVDDVFANALAQRRFSMRLIAFFAASALALAVVGLYGVIALSVNNRRREIGVRMAVGARPGDVIRLVLGEGLAITTIGIVVGLVGAFAASRVLANLLYGVSATDGGVYIGAALVTIVVTLTATLLPAKRAAAIDPTTALRD
ncbi:MAG TPA: ABC transporter permease [Gemmatimonadaceae bacterium]|jgi:predicted permease